MKNSGVCPKCQGTDIKINSLSSLNNMTAGNFYRCKSCGFTEIWSDKTHQRDIKILLWVAAALVLITVAYLGFTLIEIPSV